MRTQHVYHRPNCILCAVPEMTRHAVAFCKFMAFAVDAVHKAFGPVWAPPGQQVPLQELLLDHSLLSLKTTQGLVMWVASLVACCLRCDAMFTDASPDLHEFMSRWALVLLWWATSDETSLYRQEAVHVFRELQKFLNGQSMFAGGTVNYCATKAAQAAKMDTVGIAAPRYAASH